MSTPTKRFLDALSQHNILTTGDIYGELRFACPSHKGDANSCVASRGDDGRLIVYCHSQKCSAESIVQSVGMDVREMFPLTPERHHNGKQSKRDVVRKVEFQGKEVTLHATRDAAALAAAFGIASVAGKAGWKFTQRKSDVEYDYFHADGRIAFVVCRWQTPGRTDSKTKEIRQISPHGDGWICKALESNCPLYRLPVLVSNEVRTVYVCEGEKAADALDAIGVVSTTSSQGANSENKSNWSTLAGKRVVILPDHDQSGDHFAGRVAGLIRQQAPGGDGRDYSTSRFLAGAARKGRRG